MLAFKDAQILIAEWLEAKRFWFGDVGDGDMFLFLSDQEAVTLKNEP